MHVAQELVSTHDKLPSLPTLYYRVREALEDPEISVNDLADLISNDPALAGALLRLANSAFYGFPRKIETLTRAISLIGLEQVGDIVLASTLTATFGGIRPQRMDMARFWRGSVRRALLCRAIARHHGEREPERLFVVGLLSDMGHLVMYHTVPDLIGVVLDMPSADIYELAEHERRIVGCDFSEVGAALTLSWRLPVAFGAIVGAQLSPPHAGHAASDAAVLNLAVLLSEAIEEKVSQPDPYDLPLHPETLLLANVEVSVLGLFTEQVEAQLSSVLASLGLDSR